MSERQPPTHLYAKEAGVTTIIETPMAHRFAYQPPSGNFSAAHMDTPTVAVVTKAKKARRSDTAVFPVARKPQGG